MASIHKIGIVVALGMMGAVSAAAAASPGDPGEPVRISGDLPERGDVGDPHLSPDGRFVVYEADDRVDGIRELYSAPVDGGPPVRLQGLKPGSTWSGSSVPAAPTYEVSPDSSRVVYNRNRIGDDPTELYSVRIAGGGRTKLSTQSFNGRGNVHEWVISPDSSTVVYKIRFSLSDGDVRTIEELHAVPLAGGTSVELAGSPEDEPVSFDVVSGGVARFKISPDSRWVVYVGGDVGPEGDGDRELWSVPIDGGTSVRLGPASAFQVSPDSARVVYSTAAGVWSVPIGGGSATRLSDALEAGGRVDSFFSIAPDSSRVVYRASDAAEVWELYSVPLAGGTPTKLNGPLAAGGDVQQWIWLISPDSARVVYVADQDTDGKRELYSVPIGGGTSTKLNGRLPAKGDVSHNSRCNQPPLISPDSSTVVYRADQDTNNKWELYSVPIAGGAPVKLNAPLPRRGDVTCRELLRRGPIGGVAIAPDSSAVVYVADQDTNNVRELYSVPIGGGTPTKLNGPLPRGGDLMNHRLPFMAITADSSSVVYGADQDTNNKRELYAVDLS